MRKNLPVTSIEFEMEDGRPIVSKTDLKGKITYINPYFIEVSGFTEDELIGAPHNLVRHPDMPPQAFADLWQCLKAGLPWTGMVKNRRKNGDFYWVVANVTPVMEYGRVTGYMSIRSKPSRAQIEAADRLYRSINSGEAKGIAIRQGQVARTGWIGKLLALRNMSLHTRLMTMGAVTCALFAAMGLGDINPLLGAGAGIVSTVAGIWLLHGAIVAPLQEATRAARALAGGDLTGTISAERGDDMGQLLRALQQMNVNLVAMIGDVRGNVDAMNAATRDIAAGNQHLSGRTEAQASSLEETASSMEEFSSTVKQNADSAQQANRLVAGTSEVASRGGSVVASVGATMGDISASARKIVDIIGMIDSIAFQTNILALNAAVEAARAGEQGRGFAVVASEVRNLAQRSAAAAKDIKTLIDDSVQQVERGGKLVGEAGQTMEEIIASVQRVSSIMSEIELASREQSSGIEQVNQAIGQMDEGTQQNAALVEEAAAAADSLNLQAVQLAQAVGVFHLPRRAGDVLALGRHSQRPAAQEAAAGDRQRLAG
ncbi:methyl-accepting chemotaxis protein [Pseudoduganella sp. OTU4001]|uniref:methyl-accepting chemotaxis protein n=1 Tax=Pseudoduganella sp. OTU4001 TaxID=3043854 RepID=UPI00313ACB85